MSPRWVTKRKQLLTIKPELIKIIENKGQYKDNFNNCYDT